MVGMKFICCVSLGKDSLAMLLRLLEEGYPLDAVVYFHMDGAEFSCMETIQDQVQRLLDERQIPFIVLHPEHSFSYYLLDKKITKRDGRVRDGYQWCGGKCRWGTALKFNGLENYYKTLNDDITEYVGIAYDEMYRTERNQTCRHRKMYPLIDWQMSEADCLRYCYNRGFHWLEDGIELYDILDRVSCKYCRNKNLHELKNIYFHLPFLWDELKELQRRIPIPFYQGLKTIEELELRFVREGYQTTLFDYLKI